MQERELGKCRQKGLLGHMPDAFGDSNNREIDEDIE